MNPAIKVGFMVVLVIVGLFVVGCDTYETQPTPTQQTQKTQQPSVDYEKDVSSEFIDDSDDMSIGEMV